MSTWTNLRRMVTISPKLTARSSWDCSRQLQSKTQSTPRHAMESQSMWTLIRRLVAQAQPLVNRARSTPQKWRKKTRVLPSTDLISLQISHQIYKQVKWLTDQTRTCSVYHQSNSMSSKLTGQQGSSSKLLRKAFRATRVKLALPYTSSQQASKLKKYSSRINRSSRHPS